MKLSPGQIRQFKEEGYVIVENLIDEAALSNWRGQVWRTIGRSPDEPSAWPSGRLDPEGFAFTPHESAFGRHPAITDIIDQMGGGAFPQGGGSPIIRFPDHPAEWHLPTRGHIDGYPGSNWYPFMMGATTYLYDVAPRGGGFCYWPRSHHSSMAYFREHSDQLDHGTRGGKTASIDALFREHPQPPNEFIASAGTVIFWHAFLSHEGSMNALDWPRMGMFGRWTRVDQYDITHDWVTGNDPWKYFGPEVRDA